MNIFGKFGDILIRIFSFVGMLIMSIPKIPQLLRNANTGDIRKRIDSEKIKGNISKIKNNLSANGVKEIHTGEKQVKSSHPSSKYGESKVDSDTILISGGFTSKEKENTILQLQLASAAFLVLSILQIFNFLSLVIFVVLGGITAAYIIYMLFTRVNLMYRHDFNAYRDFFLMYLAVGIILILVGSNPNLVMAFSFEFLPSLSVLLYAVIAVAAVFLIFRIRYSRKFTYGVVMEAGKNTAHVKVEYDIRSNVKPDLYLVENSYGAVEGNLVKLKIEEKLFSAGGNKPISILKVINKI